MPLLTAYMYTLLVACRLLQYKHLVYCLLALQASYVDEYGDYEGRMQECDAEDHPIDSDAEDSHNHTEQASHPCSKVNMSFYMTTGTC